MQNFDTEIIAMALIEQLRYALEIHSQDPGFDQNMMRHSEKRDFTDGKQDSPKNGKPIVTLTLFNNLIYIQFNIYMYIIFSIQYLHIIFI